MNLMHVQSNVNLAAYQINAVNRVLLRSDAYCMNDTSCEFYAQGKGAIPAVRLLCSPG